MALSDTDLKTRFPIKASLLNEIETKKFNELINSEMVQLYKDYENTETTFEDFCNQTIWHESIGMKILANRLLLKLGPKWIEEKLKTAIKKIDPDSQYYLHPIFYLRITSPEISHEHTISSALFDSQPHYDRSFGLKAFSFWIALVDVAEDTGGLCFFNKHKNVEKLFPSQQRINKYDSTNYLRHHDFVDKQMYRFVQHPKLSSGQAYVFSWYDLHGATKPIDKKRISFDIRIHDQMILNKENKPFILYAFQRSINLSMLLSLYQYGDEEFFIKNKCLHYVYEVLTSIQPKGVKLDSTSKRLKWREEYCWVENQNFRDLFEKDDFINKLNSLEIV